MSLYLQKIEIEYGDFYALNQQRRVYAKTIVASVISLGDPSGEFKVNLTDKEREEFALFGTKILNRITVSVEEDTGDD